jgi:hypothetical protein
MKQILQNQIIRLAKIYTSKKVSVENFEFHYRVAKLQVEAIRLKKAIRK